MSTIVYKPATLPSLPSLLREIGGLFDVIRRRRSGPAFVAARRGDGRPVMVLPGFLANDGSTSCLRQTLAAAGYRVNGWGLGQNLGVRAELLGSLADRVASHGQGRPVSLVGWSLGGLYARELAKQRPELVERVITLGSPFSGDPRANHAWRLYELMNDHPVDNPPIPVQLAAKPPVKTIALWSSRDGIVGGACARGEPGETDHAIAVDCLHVAFTSDARAIAAVFDALEI